MILPRQNKMTWKLWLGAFVAGCMGSAPPVKSYQEVRKFGIVQQTSTASCGQAALTMLFHRWGWDMTEDQVQGALNLQDSADGLIPDLLQSRDVPRSLLDLKVASEFLGMKARVVEFDSLRQAALNAPILLLVADTGTLLGQGHFVLLEQVVDSWVCISDPLQGRRIIPLSQLDRLDEVMKNLNKGKPWLLQVAPPKIYARTPKGAWPVPVGTAICTPPDWPLR